MYSQSTSGSTQPGERPATTRSGDVSSTRQHSIMGHATKEEEEEDCSRQLFGIGSRAVCRTYAIHVDAVRVGSCVLIGLYEASGERLGYEVEPDELALFSSCTSRPHLGGLGLGSCGLRFPSQSNSDATAPLPVGLLTSSVVLLGSWSRGALRPLLGGLVLGLAQWSCLHHCSFITPSFNGSRSFSCMFYY